MTTDEKANKPVHTMADRIAELRERKERAQQGERPDSIDKQHERGKLTARERCVALLDEGSFVEFDSLAVTRARGFGMENRRVPGDGVVTGWGTIDGRKVFVFSQDFTFIGGTLGEVYAEKICKIMDLAASTGAPVIGINDGGGARVQEGMISLAGYAYIFDRNVRYSGVVPQISIVAGPCAGGAVYSPAITDFIYMVKGIANMQITGPDVIKAVTGEDVTLEDLGGAMTHATKSGVACFVAEDEEDCYAQVRHLLSYLPSNNLEEPPYMETGDPAEPHRPRSRRADPDRRSNQPYDMHDVINRVIDKDTFYEYFPFYAPNIITGFARLGGHSVGIIANQPKILAGVAERPSVGEGGPFHPDVRRVQRPDRDVHGRPRLPAGYRPGVGRHHPPRREAALRVHGGDRPAAHGHHAQGVRRRVRRHELQAHPRGHLLRLADRRVRRDGSRTRRCRSSSGARSRRRTTRPRSGPSSSPSTRRSSSTRGSPLSAATSTT